MSILSNKWSPYVKNSGGRSRTKSGRRFALEELESRVVLSNYYVSPTGNNSAAGTASAPWLTLQSAVSHLQPGDTLNVEAGSYAGFMVGWDPAGTSVYGTIAGTAGHPITIQADPAAVPGSVIVNSRCSQAAVGIDLEPGCDYITIKGFTVDGAGSTITTVANRGYGIKITGSNDQVIGNTVKNLIGAAIAGIHDNGGNNALIQGNTITGVQSGGDSAKGHGIYVANATGVQITGNTIHDNAYIGIHINGDPNVVSNALISGNLIYNNGGNGINADGLQNSVVENNLIYGYQNYGIALYQIDSSGGSKNNVIVNNTIASPATNAAAAIRILDAGTGNAILNNILLGGGGITYRVSADSLPGLISDYNVVGALDQSEDTGATETLAQWQTQTGQDAHSFVASPSQLFANAASNDYHLSSSSSAIDVGTSTNVPATDLDGNPRPSGKGYDIGACEYQSAAATTPPTVTGETPAPNATGVPSTTTVTATFNKSIQAGTLSFVLTGPNTTAIPATVSYNDTTHMATLTPSAALAASTTYRATVSGAKDAVGSTMAGPFSWSFTTAAPATTPTVTGETPAPNATGVPSTTTVTATFNKSIQAGTLSFVLTGPNTTAVPATVSYNDATHTAMLTPSAALAAGKTYTATVSGAKDAANGTMAAPCSWSFTTASASSDPLCLWSSTAKPVNASDPDTNQVELGVKFRSDVAGSITGIRFYKGSGNTGTHVAHLWSSTGQLLASATFTGETVSGWQQVNFAQPVPIAANTIYVASYYAPAGHYADDTGYFTSGYNSGPLHVPASGGVYAYGSGGGFPTQTWNASNYWVDLVLTTSASSPVSSSSKVATSSAIIMSSSAVPPTTVMPSVSSQSSNVNPAPAAMDQIFTSSGSLHLSNIPAPRRKVRQA